MGEKLDDERTERLISDAIDRIAEAHEEAYGFHIGYATIDALYAEMRAVAVAAGGGAKTVPNWQTVPKKPSKRMLNAVAGPKGYCSIPAAEIWEKMLAAAPAYPAPEKAKALAA